MVKWTPMSVMNVQTSIVLISLSRQSDVLINHNQTRNFLHSFSLTNTYFTAGLTQVDPIDTMNSF